MAWVTPKINWQPTDYINFTDLNRIKNNITALRSSMSQSMTTFTRNIPVGQYYTTTTITKEEARYYYRYNTTFTGQTSGQTYNNSYYFHEAGTYTFGEDCPFIGKEPCTARIIDVITKGGYGITLDSMFRNKTVNDLWYADEFNTVINNLDKLAEACGVDFIGKPYYYPNGATPTAEELNTIERTTRNLYNLINNPYRIYIGIGGYVGGRLTNALL